MGYDTVTISGLVNMIGFKEICTLDNGEYVLIDIRTGLIVAIFNIGRTFGGIFLSKIGDVYGRHIGLMFSMLVYITGTILIIAATNK